MARKLEELTTAEIEQALLARKRAETERRLGRLRAQGRVVDPPGAPIESVPLVVRGKKPLLRRLADSALLLVELAALAALLLILASLWLTNRQLNNELAAAQRAAGQSLALPTPTAPPLIGAVVLPSGHRPPVDGLPPQPGEAGPIPAHLLPAINAYVPPPIPTPGPEQARRLEIPSINVDHPIVQGDDWEQLKKGVGQYVASGRPGQPGNVVLSAHNDIYGEVFRYLDKLQPGDEVVVSTERQAYTYVVDEVRVVAPTDVWVMAPTEEARVTLISCYPYRVNTSRIVVFGRLVEPDA
jgi:sortase A